MKYQKSDWAARGRSAFSESYSQRPPTLTTAQCLTCHDLQMQSQNWLAARRSMHSGATGSTQSGPSCLLNKRLFGHFGGSGSTLLKFFCFGSGVGFACCFVEMQASRVRLISDEDFLWYNAVNSLRPVDDLSDMIVHRHAGDHVRFVARNLREAFRYEGDGFANRHFHGILQARAQPHHHPMRRRLGAWPIEFHILAQHELKLAAQAGLDGRQIDFAMALGRVPVEIGRAHV